MNKTSKFLIASFFLGVVAFTVNFFIGKNHSELSSLEKNLKEHPAYDNYLKSKQLFAERKDARRDAFTMRKLMHLMRANPNTGTIDPADIYKVRQQIESVMAKRSRSSMGLVWEELGPDNVGGRCRAIVCDKDNPLLMWAGSVTGGLFVSQNGGLDWSPVDGFNYGVPYPGVGHMAQAANGDIYIATGEGFGIPGDGYAGYGLPPFSAPTHIGNGIYKSSDRFQTFEHLAATQPTGNNQNDGWAVINKLATHPTNPNIVYAATRGGLKISTDAGQTWENVQGVPALQNRNALEVVIGQNGYVYACINDRQFYYSTDGINFENRTGLNGYPPLSETGRTEFVVSPQDPNYVYACLTRGTGVSAGLSGIWRSKDAGDSWELLIKGDNSLFNPLGQQGGWNIAFAVDPSNKERIYIGGQLEVWSWSALEGWNLIAYWQLDSPANPYYVHADNHAIAFRPGSPNVMYIGNDGGVFQTENAQARFPTFRARNKGFNTLQAYGIGASIYGQTIAGSQDNGTQFIPLNGNTTRTAIEVRGGDGGYCEISKINPNVMFASSYSGSLTRSSNGGASFGCFFDETISPSPQCESANRSFVCNYILWEQVETDNVNYPIDSTFDGTFTYLTYRKRTSVNEKSAIYFPTQDRLFVCPDPLFLSGESRWFPIVVQGNITGLRAADDGTVYAGTIGGRLYRIEGVADKYRVDTVLVNTTTDTVGNIITVNIDSVYQWVPDFPTNSRPGNWTWGTSAVSSYQGITRTEIANSSVFGARYISGIGIDPNNSKSIVVSLAQYGFSNYVFKSDPATNHNTFVSIQNNLPHFPVYDALIDYYDNNNILLATDVGIWASTDGGASWEYNETEFPHVPVFMLRQDALYSSDCRVIYAGTHGRGVWRTFSPLFPSSCERRAGIDLVSSTGKKIDITQMSANFYPNPVSNFAFLEVTLDKAQNVSIVLVDLLGRTYDQAKVNQYMKAGITKLSFDFSNLPSGSYIMSVRTKEKSLTRNIVVMH